MCSYAQSDECGKIVQEIIFTLYSFEIRRYQSYRYAVVRKYLITKAVKYGLVFLVLRVRTSHSQTKLVTFELRGSLGFPLYWDFYVVEVYFKIEIINLIYIYKLPKTLFR